MELSLCVISDWTLLLHSLGLVLRCNNEHNSICAPVATREGDRKEIITQSLYTMIMSYDEKV